MKNAFRNAKSIGWAGIFYILTFNLSSAQTNGSEKTSTQLQTRVTNQLSAFEKDKSLEKLKGAIADLKNAESENDRIQLTSMWFDLLAAIDRNLDSNFNETNAGFSRNLVPPPDNGVQYPSGVDPSVIKDSKARAEYEAAIKMNSEKAQNYTFQVNLHRLDDQATAAVEKSIRASYASPDFRKKELDERVDKSSMSPARKQKIKSFTP